MSKHSQASKRRKQEAPAKAQISEAPASPVEPSIRTSITHEQIATRAYQLWEDRGCPGGTDREDWLEAERELRHQAKAH